ncbi:hypothetical protein CRG98_050368 [Punica granatum]|uniref:Uncharacterized protein n=1 Tax=Punica granatum TaxID=22663 RepID=A0A2I0GBV6_PUNGR|nr:hypothetical protein CRG98_050368 [Punica granatum]
MCECACEKSRTRDTDYRKSVADVDRSLGSIKVVLTPKGAKKPVALPISRLRRTRASRLEPSQIGLDSSQDTRVLPRYPY